MPDDPKRRAQKRMEMSEFQRRCERELPTPLQNKPLRDLTVLDVLTLFTLIAAEIDD